MTYEMHNLTGRLRIKSPKLEDKKFADQLILNVLKQKGIENIDINSKQNSVVVHYNPDLIGLQQLFTILQLDYPIEVEKNISNANEKELIDDNKNSLYTNEFLYQMLKTFRSSWIKAVLKQSISLIIKDSISNQMTPATGRFITKSLAKQFGKNFFN